MNIKLSIPSVFIMNKIATESENIYKKIPTLGCFGGYSVTVPTYVYRYFQYCLFVICRVSVFGVKVIRVPLLLYVFFNLLFLGCFGVTVVPTRYLRVSVPNFCIIILLFAVFRVLWD